MQSMERHYFVCANTARGFTDYSSGNLEGLDRIFILKGGSGTGKSTMMKKIGEAYQECDYPVEYWHCASDPQSLDGVIIPDLHAAVVDGTAPHVIEAVLPGAIEDYVNLGLALERKKLEPHKAEMLSCKKAIGEQYQALYQHLYSAAEVKALMQQNLPPEESVLSTEMAAEVIAQILGTQVYLQEARVRHRFYRALTPQGMSTIGLESVARAKKRYCLNGQAVGGLLVQLLEAAGERGLTVEAYHSNLQPDVLEMLYLPALDTVVLDGSVQELEQLCTPQDMRYDFAQSLPEEHGDERRALLNGQRKQYEEALLLAAEALAQARSHHGALEKRYYQAVDFAIIEQIHDAILSELSALG